MSHLFNLLLWAYAHSSFVWCLLLLFCCSSLPFTRTVTQLFSIETNVFVFFHILLCWCFYFFGFVECRCYECYILLMDFQIIWLLNELIEVNRFYFDLISLTRIKNVWWEENKKCTGVYFGINDKWCNCR